MNSCIINCPKHIEPHRLPGGLFWHDELDDIWCGVSAKVKRTRSLMTDTYKDLRSITGRKVRLLWDATEARPMDKDIRDLIYDEMKKTFTAIAVVSGSPMGLMVAAALCASTGCPVPLKFFHKEDDARRWLKKF
ncbi:MAG: STAS/SEC14 domain-containing protein [Bacteroidota bacterium]